MRNKRGFTLIELLVVIAIIGVLASVVLASLNEAREKARDATRKQSLTEVANALQLYWLENNNMVETGSGCGYSGNGNGWLSYTNGTTYPNSISDCLVNAGFLPSDIIDPSGNVRGSGRNAFMKYSCTQGTYLYANLESIEPPSPPARSNATDGTCCPACDTRYGMDYYLKVE